MSRKIAIICPHPEGVAPGQRLKYEQYFTHWRENGWQVDVYPFQSYRFWQIAQRGNILEKIFWTLVGYFHRFLFLFKIRQYDIAYIFLWVTPFGPPIFEWLYCKLARRVVFDIDDLVFLGNTSTANTWVSKLKGKQKPIYLMKKADAVITTTKYLVELSLKFNNNVTSIPPTIDENIIFPKKRTTGNEKRIRIGWSGSSSTLKYLKIVESALQKTAKEYDIELLIFGTSEYPIEGVKTICIEWKDSIENEIINQFDIGIYPLEKELWSEGKFGGKLIQYLAAGVPSISSNSNSTISTIIKNNVNGIIVDNIEAEWYHAFRALIESEELRINMGNRARTQFVKYYSTQANRDKYLNILHEVSAR